MAEKTVARTFLVRGRVQGVGYRYFAQRAAEEIGVTGWVRNLDDGSVEAFAQGTSAQLSDFESRLRAGPRWSDVRSVETAESAPAREPTFRIRH